MEELVEILINLIVNLFQNKAINQSQSRRTPPPPIPKVPQSQQPVAVRKPAPRRVLRRPPPPLIAVAQPIITKSAPPAPAAVSATAGGIRVNQGIVKPNTVAPESASSIRQWLTPATLKNQFLLTEILQPPLALREKRY